MQELSVPKHKVPVEMVLTDGRELRLELFLADFAQAHVGPERVSDLLIAEGEFLPAGEPSTGAFCLVNRQSVLFLRVDRALEEDATDAPVTPIEHQVDLFFSNGNRLRGLTRY